MGAVLGSFPAPGGEHGPSKLGRAPRATRNMPDFLAHPALAPFNAFPALWLGLFVSVSSWALIFKNLSDYARRKSAPRHSLGVMLLCVCASAFYFLTYAFVRAHLG